MAFAPFRQLLALIVLDGDFDLTQDLLTGLADGCAQGGDGLRRVEIKDVQEITTRRWSTTIWPIADKEGVIPSVTQSNRSGDCEPEGRHRKNYHLRKPGRRAGPGGEKGPAGGHRSSGKPDHRLGISKAGRSGHNAFHGNNNFHNLILFAP